MKSRTTQACIILLIFLVWTVSVSAEVTGRYFDTLDKKSDVLTVTIMYPSQGTLRSLMALMDEGFFPGKDIIVVGAHHEDEFSDYMATKIMAEEQGLDWLKFHTIQGALNRDNLYQQNECAADFDKIFKYSDGMIFFGGADIPPELYGRKTNLLTGIRTPYRHYVELSFIFHLMGGFHDEDFKPLMADRTDFPVLCICLGEQTLNVATGGTLIQDIWFEKYNRTFIEDIVPLGREKWHNNPLARINPEDDLLWYNMHTIKLLDDGKFVKEMGFTNEDMPYIVSSHHQAVDKKGKGIRINATSLDGKIPEAIEHVDYPNVLGLQFHPEFSTLYQTEKKFRIEQDDEPFTLRSVLEENPPSYKFHKGIWAWYVSKLNN